MNTLYLLMAYLTSEGDVVSLVLVDDKPCFWTISISITDLFPNLFSKLIS